MFNKLTQTAVLITLITLLSKISGFIRDVFLAAYYGTTIYSDSFIMAQTIIGVVLNIVLAALGTTIIPVLSDYLLRKNKSAINNHLNVLFTITTLVTVFLSIIGLVFTSTFVQWLAPEFSLEAKELTIQLVRIMLPVIVFSGLVTLITAKLQAHGSFLIPATIGLPLNFSMILTMIFFTSTYGIHGLAVGYVVGMFLQLLLQMPFSKKLGYHLKISFNFNEEGVRRIGLLIVPIIIGSGIQQMNIIIDRVLASGLPQGSIAALNFSNRFSLFLIGLLSAAVVSIFYKSMSNYVSEGNEAEFKKLLRNTINVSTILIVPASIGFMVLSLPLVKLIFERGVFDTEASELTAVALFYYAIGLVGFLLREAVSRAFYAIKDTKTAMINGSVAVVINIILSIILVRYLGLGGIALGTSISGIIGTVLLMYSMYRKIGDYGLRDIINTFFKVLTTSLVMGISVHYCYEYLINWFGSNAIALSVSIFVGMTLYIVLIGLFRVDEVHSLIQILRRSLRRNKKVS